MSDAFLSVEHISKRFRLGGPFAGRKAAWLSAVDDVSFTVEPGEVLGLVGESGSGKSTLARMLVQLLAPTGGRIVFRGQDITQLGRRDARDIRRRIQIVFQDPYSSLDPRMRVRAVIGEGLYHSKLGRRALASRVGELLEVVGLPGRMADAYPHQLSGGERQRVGIARALASGPDLLIADEPVSALDASVQGQVLNLLRDLQSTRNLAMIFVAHELPVARYMSDSLAVMHLGRLIEFGRADEVFARPAHPYTQALVAAMPSYGRQRSERAVLAGDAGAELDVHPHCRFSSRCPRALERCLSEDPVLRARPRPEPLGRLLQLAHRRRRGCRMNEPVEITAADGVTLRGEVHRGSPYWAILVHDRGADLESLRPLASRARARGVLGARDRPPGPRPLGRGLGRRGLGARRGGRDLVGAPRRCRTGLCRSRRRKRLCPLRAAGPGLVAAAVLLGPRPTPGCTTELIRRWCGPRLFVVGSNDVEGEAGARRIFDACVGPRLFVQLPTDARVHDLLIGEHASQALSHAVGYLAQNRSDIEHAA